MLKRLSDYLEKIQWRKNHGDETFLDELVMFVSSVGAIAVGAFTAFAGFVYMVWGALSPSYQFPMDCLAYYAAALLLILFGGASYKYFH